MAKLSLGRRIRDLFSSRAGLAEVLEDLEDTLIESDLGAVTAMELLEEVEEASKKGRITDRAGLLGLLADRLSDLVREVRFAPDPSALTIYLVLGVNGVGKTTTIAKLAHHFSELLGKDRIVLAAGDTFRAAAIEQLTLHGSRLGVRVVRQDSGSDPAAVIFDAVAHAKAQNAALVLADTAGRMHNKEHLVRQLEKIDKIVRTRAEGAEYRKLLVIDATTGQNGLRQAEIFHEAVGIDGVVLAKYDSSARGGIAVAICRSLGIPIAFLGVGEKMQDLVAFSRERYIADLLAESPASGAAHGEVASGGPDGEEPRKRGGLFRRRSS